MKIHSFLTSLLIVACCACGRKEQTAIYLTPGTIYSIDSVKAAIASGRGMTTAQEKELAEATARYRKHQQYGPAIDSLTSLIYQAPSAQAYFELGTALLLDKQFDSAARALTIAEQLHYAPLYNVLYMLSAAYSNSPDNGNEKTHADDLSLYYMQIAVQMGYPHPENFKKDPAFKDWANNNNFKEAFNGAMSGRKDLAASLWGDFLAGFPILTLPLQIDTQWRAAHPFGSEQDIDFNFEKYVTEIGSGKFDRGSEPGFYYVGSVKTDSNYTALIYAGTDDAEGTVVAESTDSTAEATSSGPIYFYLTTYSRKGKIIDKIMIAGQEDYEHPFKFFAISPSLDFSVSDNAFTYAKDPVKYGYDGNPIAADTVTAVQHYRIDAQGKFQKVEAQPLALR